MLSRVGVSLDDVLLAQFDALIEARGYQNRSEAIRDLIREELVKEEWTASTDPSPKVAVAVLVYDHDSLDVGRKLTRAQHDKHDIIVSTTHVHIDAHNCLEVIIMRGPGDQIKDLGNSLVSARGVKLGRLSLATTGESLK